MYVESTLKYERVSSKYNVFILLFLSIVTLPNPRLGPNCSVTWQSCGFQLPQSCRQRDRGKVYPCIVASFALISRALEELHLTVLPVFILSLWRSVFLDILSRLCQKCFPSQLNFNVPNFIQILGSTPKYFYKSYSFSLKRNNYQSK